MRNSNWTDGIDILAEDHIEKQLSSDSEKDDEKNNLELPTAMLMIANTSKDDPNNFEKTYVDQLYNSCIENKHTKIVKHKKMTPTTCK